MPFTFETGDRSNSTQPGPHVLAGYLTLTGADTGTGYVMAQKAGTASLNFEALKSQTPAYQTYSLKKDQAQWIPILALKPETDYDIYVGVELADGSDYTGVVTAKTATQLPGSWHIVNDEQPDPRELKENMLFISRKIDVYEGQTILLPSISEDSQSVPRWLETDTEPEVLISFGDYIDVDEAKGLGLDEAEILTDVGDITLFDYAYFSFRSKVTSSAKRNLYMTTQVLGLTPHSITYIVNVVQ